MVVSVYSRRSHEKLLDYTVPERFEKQIHLYQRIRVDLLGEKQTALVMQIGNELHHTAADKKDRVKDISGIIDEEPILTEEQVNLARDISRRYLCSHADALFTMLPAGRRENSFDTKLIEDQQVTPELPPLLPAQNDVVEAIVNSGFSSPEAHLLFGVTGSGKTRVYLELIKYYLKKEESVLFLLPEIALSYQFLSLLKPVFKDQMAILHSGLARSERFKEYKRVLRKEARLVVGTRSAVFAPARFPGLIIIDEEHDSSYKEHSSPRYHTRQVAFMRLKAAPVSDTPRVLLLGSATPSVETWYSAKTKRIHLHMLTERATGFSLPAIHLPRFDTTGTNSAIFSPFLLNKMDEHLSAGNQVMLLMNRRGFSHYAFCENCEQAIQCNHCSISLTHHHPDILKCHLCGFQTIYTGRCPECNHKLKLRGKGIQKVEDELELHFREIPYGRLDHDTASIKDYTANLLEAVKNKDLRILLGTQMIAKGFDIPGITLVGILNADIGLNLPDFRAAERVFQLLVQASGRAGRHQKGEVVMQTMQPEHYAIHFARNLDYETFASHELNMRKSLLYPPFHHLFRFLAESEDEEKLKHFMNRLKAEIENHFNRNSLFDNSLDQETPADDQPYEIMGPVEAPMYRLKQKYRMQFVIKDQSIHKILVFGKHMIQLANQVRNKFHVNYRTDVDPLDMQ